VASYTSVPPNSVEQLKAAIDKKPVSVAFAAGTSSFQMYTSGIYDDKECARWGVDSVMTAVGYGKTASGDEYYIVRNNWSAQWGDNGYIKIAAQEGPGICGIQTRSYYPETSS